MSRSLPLSFRPSILVAILGVAFTFAHPAVAEGEQGRDEGAKGDGSKDDEPKDEGAKDDKPKDEKPKAEKAKAAPKEGAAEERPKRIEKIRHVNIRARDLRLTDTSRDRLARIAKRYHAATGKDLVVTGGSRSTKRQAELMIAKLDNGDDITKLYEQKAACAEIVAAYRAATGDGKKKKRIGVLERVRGVIDAQVARGVYVSRHLQSGATDVRSRDMTAAQERALRAAVAAEPGVSMLDERKSVEPHFHLNL